MNYSMPNFSGTISAPAVNLRKSNETRNNCDWSIAWRTDGIGRVARKP